MYVSSLLLSSENMCGTRSFKWDIWWAHSCFQDKWFSSGQICLYKDLFSFFLECVYFGLLYPSLIFDMFIVVSVCVCVLEWFGVSLTAFFCIMGCFLVFSFQRVFHWSKHTMKVSALFHIFNVSIFSNLRFDLNFQVRKTDKINPKQVYMKFSVRKIKEKKPHEASYKIPIVLRKKFLDRIIEKNFMELDMNFRNRNTQKKIPMNQRNNHKRYK